MCVAALRAVVTFRGVVVVDIVVVVDVVVVVSRYLYNVPEGDLPCWCWCPSMKVGLGKTGLAGRTKDYFDLIRYNDDFFEP